MPAREIFKTMAPFGLRYKKQIIFAIIALILAAVITLIFPVSIRYVIDQGFNSNTNLNTSFLILGALAILLSSASALRYFLVTSLGERIIATIRSEVFDHIIDLDKSFFDQAQSGELLSRLGSDTTLLKSAFGVSVSMALRNIAIFIGAIIMMLITNLEMAFLVFLAIPPIVGSLLFFGKIVQSKSKEAQDELASTSALASEVLSSAHIVQMFNGERYVSHVYDNASWATFNRAKATITIRSLLYIFAGTIISCAVVAVLWKGANDVRDGIITAGLLSQFLIYAILAASSLGTLGQVWGEVMQALGAAERIAQILSTKAEIQSPAHGQAKSWLEPVKGQIKFNHVKFAYPSRQKTNILHDVSFRIEPGEKVAFVGPSGAGKSSLFHLVSRLYDPGAGEILVDDINIKEVELGDLRKQITIVPQDPIVFNTTIAENIAFAADHDDMDRVIAAGRAANAHDFIQALPDQYHTRIGERGLTLSGGQRQRLAIARAIYKDAQILLMDEATSALDTESEHLVQQGLKELFKDRTTLVIAHRLSTVRDMDRIIVMDKGIVVEQGSHNALMKENGLYKRLAKTQIDQ